MTISVDEDVPREITTPVHFYSGKVSKIFRVCFLAKIHLFIPRDFRKVLVSRKGNGLNL